MHQVMTATRTHRNANPEYHEAELDKVEMLDKDGSQVPVRSAPIIAIGVGASEGMTRLALSGGRHVDVDRKWFNAQHPYVGGFYVQHEDGSAEVAGVERFAWEPAPQSEQAAHDEAQARVKDLEAQLAATTEGRDAALQALADAASRKDPSAADLDAVAEEQEAADATAAPVEEDLDAEFENKERADESAE
jgi:hypothetical protein